MDIWQKNFLTEEGTGINIYDSLKHLSETILKEYQNCIAFYQSQFTKLIGNERESADVFIISQFIEL